MKYERTERFKAEFLRLSNREQRLFLDAVRLINAAYEGRGESQLPAWPTSLRIGLLTDHPGIHELTWSFAGRPRHLRVCGDCRRGSHPLATDRPA